MTRVDLCCERHMPSNSRDGMPGFSHPMSRMFVLEYVGVICVVAALMGCQPGELRKQSGRARAELEKAIDIADE